jgi:hypothetical protein
VAFSQKETQKYANPKVFDRSGNSPTNLVDVPIYSECAACRASALALPPRATARHGRFSVRSPIKSVYRHTENGKKNAPPTVCSYSTARAKRASKPRCPPPKVQCLTTSTRLWPRRSLEGGHRGLRCVPRWRRIVWC